MFWLTIVQYTCKGSFSIKSGLDEQHATCLLHSRIHDKNVLIPYIVHDNKNTLRQSQIAFNFIYCVLADWLKETSYVINCCACAYVHYGNIEPCIYVTFNWLTFNLLVTCWSHSLHNLPIDGSSYNVAVLLIARRPC